MLKQVQHDEGRTKNIYKQAFGYVLFYGTLTKLPIMLP